MGKILFLMFISCLNTFAQEFIFYVKDNTGKPLPYVNVFVNDTYGIQSDTLGKLKFFNYEKPQKMLFEKTGYENIEMFHTSLKNNPEVILQKTPFQASPSQNSNSETILGFNAKQKLKEEKIHSVYSNYEAGTTFRFKEEYAEKHLSQIRFRAHQIGSSKIALRINIYDLDEKDLPRNNLLKQEIIVYPTQEKQWFELDISGQNISFPESGIAATVEVLNPYINRFKLNDNNKPFIPIYETTESNFVYRAREWNSWIGSKGKTYAIQVKLK